jgi:hypothetical protein
MTEFALPKPTPEQQVYAAGWSDPVEARRRRIEALATIVDGLHPAVYTPGISIEALETLRDSSRDDLYLAALERAKEQLLWELAWAGALDGAWIFDECGDHDGTVVRLKTDGPDPFVIATGHNSCELVHFVEMCPGYVGLPGTAAYGEDAIVELARAWLAKTS